MAICWKWERCRIFNLYRYLVYLVLITALYVVLYYCGWNNIYKMLKRLSDFLNRVFILISAIRILDRYNIKVIILDRHFRQNMHSQLMVPIYHLLYLSSHTILIRWIRYGPNKYFTPKIKGCIYALEKNTDWVSDLLSGLRLLKGLS